MYWLIKGTLLGFFNETEKVLSTIWKGVYEPGGAPPTAWSQSHLAGGCTGSLINSVNSFGTFSDCFWFGIGALGGSYAAQTPFAGAPGNWIFPDYSVSYMVYCTAIHPFSGDINMAVDLYQSVLSMSSLQDYFAGDLSSALKSAVESGFKGYSGIDASYVCSGGMTGIMT